MLRSAGLEPQLERDRRYPRAPCGALDDGIEALARAATRSRCCDVLVVHLNLGVGPRFRFHRAATLCHQLAPVG